ncbi:epsin-3 isoform X3 [Alosa sapidissima]|uniref:epsin-3 isoform X3 n=1 Tax=Alosa sapidissima TaxID=34773 RepID=UPI001C09F774|nr:epsin-3 isoform X3 [Alosa sapidissima]
MTTSSLRRSVKNMVNNYTDAEIKVREATSNDPWGPPTSLMAEIADMTFNVVAFTEVMGMIWKRLNDHGKNWRHVYKALMLLDYLIKTGSERVAQQCKENIYAIQTLRDFQYIDRDGQDQGIHVRERSKQLVSLIRDDERLRQERAQAHKTRERMAGTSMGYGAIPPPYPGRRSSQPSMGALYGEEHGRPRGSPSSYNSSSSSPQLAPDLEQARPQTSGEEELQLQLALAMSREETEKPPPPAVDIDEQTQLQIAMSLSKEEAMKPRPPPPVALDMDEETQLQIALSLSKEEHQQEQQSRRGDESMLQKALEESKREMDAKRGGSAMMDLVDIFAPAPAEPSSGHSWDLASGDVHAAPAGPLRVDPWDSLAEASSARGASGSWLATSASASRPQQSWDHRSSPADPWDAPQSAPRSNLAGQVWSSPAHKGGDLFTTPAESQRPLGVLKPSSPRAGSPSDGDLFDEAMDGGQMNVNGHGGGSPEPFDMSRLGESLADLKPRACRTPEAFLGPVAASLVNLDSLIPTSPAPKTLNPFLTGVAAGPSTTAASNPFQSDQPRLTLNEMRPNSTSPVPQSGSLPYSASLPLPLPSNPQPSSLPSSLTQPPAAATAAGVPMAAGRPLDLPGNLPQPLLPLSSAAMLGPPGVDLQNQNPFL